MFEFFICGYMTKTSAANIITCNIHDKLNPLKNHFPKHEFCKSVFFLISGLFLQKYLEFFLCNVSLTLYLQLLWNIFNFIEPYLIMNSFNMFLLGYFYQFQAWIQEECCISDSLQNLLAHQTEAASPRQLDCRLLKVWKFGLEKYHPQRKVKEK